MINDQLNETDQILQNKNLQLEGKRYTWEQLVTKVGVDICDQTMQNNMRTVFNYHKCIAYVKGWLAETQEEKQFD